MFLSVATLPEVGSVKPHVSLRWRANCPHGSVATIQVTTDSPLTLAGYSGEAAIPKWWRQEGTTTPPHSQGRFVVDLWAWFILAWARNGVGLSPVSVVDHYEQVTPPHTSWVRGNSRDASP